MAMYTDLDWARAGATSDAGVSAASTVAVYPYNNQAAKDHSKIIHSSSFRRLAGKMQLFPTIEGPELRNRLTHSLEVADIAERIVYNINKRITEENSSDAASRIIDPFVVRSAASAHDLGHPPFGHSGEIALNNFMRHDGGFEGNAQTFRILARLETRIRSEDIKVGSGVGSPSISAIHTRPFGLNLSARTLASVMKYNHRIVPDKRGNNPIKAGVTNRKSVSDAKIQKGYYKEDEPYVNFVRDYVSSGQHGPEKTIECDIMDVADDIAYSIYDLEDCFILGVCMPADIIACDDDVIRNMWVYVQEKLQLAGYDSSVVQKSDILLILLRVFDSSFRFSSQSSYDMSSMIDRVTYFAHTYRETKLYATDPSLRRKFTEFMIDQAIADVEYVEDRSMPSRSKVRIKLESLLPILALKAFNYYTAIRSPKLQGYQYRAKQIVEEICQTLFEDDQNVLFPHEVRQRYKNLQHTPTMAYNAQRRCIEFGDASSAGRAMTDDLRRRFVCDYVASLCDEEVSLLYKKLKSPNTIKLYGL